MNKSTIQRIVIVTIILVALASIWIVLATRSTINVDNSSSRTTTREFRSQRLGVSFTYASQDLGKQILVEEAGSTIYIHPENVAREQGQYVQVFSKSRDISLSQAIQQQFLSAQQLTKCQVKNGMDADGAQPTNGIAAIISFPLSTDANTDGLGLRQNCPDQYSLTNGLSFFWTDGEQSTTFVFFSIGQYFIPSTTAGTSWHTTLHFLPS